MGRVKESFEDDSIAPGDPFTSMQHDENEQLQIAKELFNEKSGLKLKTDLDDSEIRGLSKLAFIRQVFNVPSLDTWIDNFIQLRVSRKRKGRQEFIEAIKRPQEMLPKMGFFGGKQL